MKIERKNYYSTIGYKKNFETIVDEELPSMTDQSQLVSASIVEMAKKYGIEAIISRAEQTKLEAGSTQSELYGIDLTNGFKSKEQMMGVGNKLKTLFERIPARIRKEHFNDQVGTFIEKFTSGEINTMTKLNEIGLISDTQLNGIKTKINEQNEIAKEMERKNEFIKALETNKSTLYEVYKRTGKIELNTTNNNSSTNNSEPVQRSEGNI